MRQSWQEQTEGPYVITEATMAAGPSPTMRMRQLGMELQRLRLQAGISQNDAARWIDVTDTALSKMERGVRRVRVAYVRNLCQLYNVETGHTEFLERLARESGQRGWWVDYGNTVPNWFSDFLGMETVAEETWIYASEYFPGLLQNQAYRETVSTPDVERLRAVRQQRLTGDSPLILRVVLDEAVLCRVVGGPHVMGTQIRHVIDTARLPNVTVQVLSFSVGFHPSVTGSFTALRFPEEPLNTVYVELMDGAVYLEKPADVNRYTQTFEQLTELALNEDATTSFLKTMERRYLE